MSAPAAAGLQLDWGRLELPLSRPLPVRGRVLCRRSLLRLRLGGPGLPDCWAEAAPLPGLHRESCASLERWLAAHRERITETLSRWLVQEPDVLQPPDWPAGCAPSLTGALDRLAQSAGNRVAGRPEWQLPGLEADTRVALAPLLAGDAGTLAPPPGPGRWVIKLKLDPQALADQLENLGDWVRRLEQQGQGITVRLDANRRLDSSHLETLSRGLRGPGHPSVQWIEDPCATAQASREFCDRAGLALALDELLPAGIDPRVQDETLAALRPAALVLKPALLGGFRPLAAWAARARALGCDTVLSSCFESPWGLGRLAGWAALLAPDSAHGLGTAHFYRGPLPGHGATWQFGPGDLPAAPAHPWHHCLRWSSRRSGSRLMSLPGLRGRVGSAPGAAALPPAGSRVDLRLARQLPGEHAAATLLGLLDHGCIVFPQDGALPDGLLEERARAAGCSHRLELATGRITETGRHADPALPKDRGPLLLVSTGGSSGRTRIVIHSLRSMLAGASGALAAFPFGPGDGWLLALPLHHVGGISVLFRCLLGGGRVLHPLPGENLGQSLQRLRPSHLSLVPAQLVMLLEQQETLAVLRSSRLVLVGGAALPESLRRRALAAGIPVAASWGLTETGGQVCTAWPDRAPLDGRSCSGWPLPGRQVRVIHGELQVRGTALCEGWIQEGRFRALAGVTPWFASGDLGELDHQGAVRVRGRRQRLLISGGENLYPEDIEQVLEQHPAIRRACVLGVAHPRWGQRPVAVIQPKEEGRVLPLDPAELVGWLDHRLPRIARPDAWLAWPEDLATTKTPWGELARRLERGELEVLQG